MSTGAYISGAGHLLVILWILLGGVLFRAEDPEMVDSADVSLISEADFRALTARPEPVAAQEIAAPEPPKTETAPDVTAAPAQPVETAALPEIAAPAEPESVPAKPELRTPVAQVDATDPAELVPPAPDAVATLVPAPPTPGRAPDLPRVAPVPQPETPQADVAPEVVPSVLPAPSPTPDAPKVVETPPAAPEAATSEVVTEAVKEDKPPVAVAALRPPTRPKTPPPPKPEPKPDPKPEAQAKPAAQPEPKPDAKPAPSEDAVAAAVAAAVANGAQTPAPVPAGPPLSYGEVDALKLAMSRCWNKGALSSAASKVTVTIGVKMNRDGTPVAGSIRQISAKGGDETAVRNAFETASRAIRMCGARGLPLPPEKYAHWAEIEMTFNPNTDTVGLE